MVREIGSFVAGDHNPLYKNDQLDNTKPPYIIQCTESTLCKDLAPTNVKCNTFFIN